VRGNYWKTNGRGEGELRDGKVEIQGKGINKRGLKRNQKRRLL
jgi:hypothetical protein